MKFEIKAGAVLLALLFFCDQSLFVYAAGESWDGKKVINTYSEIVLRSYQDSYAEALKLQKVVNDFLKNPSEDSLKKAKEAWFNARVPYSQTEVYRFYEGPIDFADQKTGEQGPEGQLNAWPLNEAYIDYVQRNPKSGIINDPNIPLNEKTIIEKNAKEDEADVTTGYHAIEFLLWGQDLSTGGPGNRSVSDYIGNHLSVQRRRDYLKLTTDLLVKDLHFLVESWEDEEDDSYAIAFKKMDQKEAIGKILTGMATLSGFELASERVGVPLKSGDQEDEHSCFSDNTHNDFIQNAKGISNVYFGTYGTFKGEGLDVLAKQVDPELAAKIEKQLKQTADAADVIGHPFDQVLASPDGSAEKQKVRNLMESLEAEAQLFKELGDKLGVSVEIVRG